MEKVFLNILLVFVLFSAGAQDKDADGILKVSLESGISVWVMSEEIIAGKNMYYYLPANLRLSTLKDNTPEFSLLKYEGENGPASGGSILHFMLVWGLTQDQEDGLERTIISMIDSNAVLVGPMNMQIFSEQENFRFIEKSKLADIFRQKWSAKPVAASFPGTKMALSYRLTADETRELEFGLISPETLDKISVELIFQFIGREGAVWDKHFNSHEYILRASLQQILSPLLKSGE